MINLTTNTKSFSVEKGTAGGKSGGNGSGSTIKIIKQIINQGGGSGTGSGSGGSSYDVFTGATADNPGRQGLVPQPLAGQNTFFLKGNGLWDKVFQFIREDEEGNIYIDGKATKFGSPIYLKDIFSNQQDLAENLRKIEFHDNVQFDKKTDFVGDVSVGGSSDFLGETRFSNNVIFNRNQANGSGPNKVTVNADLEVNGKSNFTDDMTATNITVDYLTVTKLAHFFELVIDKIRASQGQIIITDANAKIDYVEKVDGVSRLYWRADSENQSNLSLNEFVEGDQIVCQTFNRGQMQKNEDGSYHGFNVSNKYYWVVCSGVGQGVEKTFPDSEGNPGEKHVYNFVEISDSDSVSPKDGAFLPEIGDEIVQLGNRRDTLRQAAIIISAYNNAYLDKGIKAPAIVQYDGINDFQLETHRLNVISKGLNRFMGSYLTPDGQTDIVDKIGNVQTITNNKFSEIQQTIDGITTSVSNNITKIDTLTGKVTTNTENISKLQVKADQISATVSNNTTKIDTLTGKVTENATNISKLDQKADRIQAQVEQIQTGTSGDLTTITNNIANLQVKADEISSTVEQHTTEIDNLTGKVTANTTNISKIDQKADSIQSTVTRIEGDYVTSSQLTQTSKEILAIVGNTYIKINDGKVIINAAIDEKTGEIRDDIDSIKRGNIELNGNTTINGNLTVQNATDGLTLVGTGGNTEIRSKDIGNFFDYIKNPTKYWEMTQNSQGPGMMEYQDGNTYKEMFVNDNVSVNQTISIPANTKVTFADSQAIFTAQKLRNMGFLPNVTHDIDNPMRYKVLVEDGSFVFIQFIVKSFEMIWTFVNKDTGALIKTFTAVNHGDFSVTEAIPNCQVRVQVYAKIDKWEVWKSTFTYNGKSYNIGSNSKVNLQDWAVPIAWTSFTFTSQSPEVNNLIGYNGQAYNFGGGDGMFIGKTGLQAKFGDYCFMINPQEIQNTTLAGNEIFRKGIWSINKYKFTQQQGPFNDFETSVSEFLTHGRGFGVKNVRVAGTSGKLYVLPEDDIIMVTDFMVVNGNTGHIDVQIYFPPCNDNTYIGHEVTIMHIHTPRSDWSSSCKAYSTNNSQYPLYNQNGNSMSEYNFGNETKTFIANYPMGCWIMA